MADPGIHSFTPEAALNDLAKIGNGSSKTISSILVVCICISFQDSTKSYLFSVYHANSHTL